LPKREPERVLKEPGVQSRFDDLKRECDALDFDDLERWGLAILEKYGAHYRKQWSHVLVDEWQDTSERQMHIIDRAWAPPHRLKVGDPRQGIYRWRNARLENILEMLDDKSVEVHYLLRNYRSTPQVIRVGNMVAEAMQQPWAKPMEAMNADGPEPEEHSYEQPDDEGEAVSERIARQITDGVRPGDIAVLARTWSALKPTRIALERQGIAVAMGRGTAGETVWHSGSARWLQHALRFGHWAHNDWSLEETLRGMTGLPVEDLDRELVAARKSAARENDVLLYHLPDQLKDFARGQIHERVFANWRDVTDAVDQLVGNEWRTPLDDDPGLVDAVTEWAFDRETVPTAREFLDWVALTELDEASLAEPDSDAVVLSTVHGAKGEEYSHVHVVGVCEGVWPSGRNAKSPGSLGEDRRLLYVAVTRAERELHISYPLQYAAGPKLLRTRRSRYLDEVNELVDAGG
jgi:DNA helicase-2/ATP-dependent DNA helicase PcrA